MRALLAVLATSLWMATPALPQDDDSARNDLEIDRNNAALVDDSDRDPVFGAGIGVTVSERVNLRTEYEVVEIDQLEDSHAVWLTAAWRF